MLSAAAAAGDLKGRTHVLPGHDRVPCLVVEDVRANRTLLCRTL